MRWRSACWARRSSSTGTTLAIITALPDEIAISAITAAELTAGPLLASTPMEANSTDFVDLDGLVRVVAF